MDRAVMRAAERHDVFIAGLAAQGARLGKSDVVGIRGPAAAEQTRLLAHETKMISVSVATWRGHSEHALIDAWGPIRASVVAVIDHLASRLRGIRSIAHYFDACGREELGCPAFER